MAVVASEDGDLVMQDPLSQESGIVAEAGDEIMEQDETQQIVGSLKLEEVPITKNPRRSDPKLQKDMETCFGFDEVSIISNNEYINYYLNQRLIMVSQTVINGIIQYQKNFKNVLFSSKL